MSRNKNLKSGIWVLSVLTLFSTASLIILNLLKVDLDSRFSDFLSGFTLGMGIVFLIVVMILSGIFVSKRIRDRFEIALDDERNKIVKEKALALSFKINMLLLLLLGLILWALNYDIGPMLVVAAIVQANIGLICWGITYKIL